MPDLGEMERVELRDIWGDEARDFTPWLAEEKNLAILGRTLGMELELKAQEEGVGPFRADILCENTEDDSPVLIENQLEPTNHKHLGQLMTYAAGLGAVSIVWVAEKFREEHRAALDWLNEITDEEYRFFGLEIELWKIGNSCPAPKFNIVSKPNDWSRHVSQAAKNANSGEMTPMRILQQRYWVSLKSFAEEKGSPLRFSTPGPYHRIVVRLGRSGTRLVARVNTQKSRISVVFRSSGPNGKKFFDLLHFYKDEIEGDLGFPLEWDRQDGKESTSVFCEREGDIFKEEQWSELHGWMIDCLEKMNRVFRPRVKRLDLSEWKDLSSSEDD